MIEIKLTPQRNDAVRELDYKINGDILTVIINGIEEVLDFTGMEDGVAEEIIVEKLPWNPIVDVKKNGDKISVLAIRFYNENELEEFENGKN